MQQEITIADLLKKLEKNIKDTDKLNEIKRAYEYAEKSHEGKKRLTGEDYIKHPLNVAYILAELNVDATTIIAALLHETINNGIHTFEDLEENFSKDVASIVKAISTINKLELQDDSDSSATYLRNVLVGLAEDVRVLYIKLADRLHNMRTIWAVSDRKQKRKANETMNVLVPIAHRLGINSIKSELENLSLKYLKPEVYNDILEKLNATTEELNDVLEEMKESISDILKENGLTFEIKGRVKSVYSIYNKLNNGKKWNDIYDFLALRVFVEKVSDCYLAVGLIHSKYRPIPKRFKDYIAMPKENMYQSLHTTIFGIDGHLFEVQIRTYEMDEIAEKGIASHWSYKEKGTKKVQNIMEQKLEMFRNIIESNENDTDLEENVTSELLNDMIYIFTPKGDVVELPKGATPIDFAYRIHSKVGDTMVGAIVNDQIVPLSYELQDNDIVKIRTSSTATPNKDWLNIVKTTQAKNKIKSYFSKQDRTMYTERGQDILEKEIRKRKLSISEILSDENISKITKDLKLKDLEDIYFSIGSLRYTAGYIINLTTEDKNNIEDALIGKFTNNNIKYDNYKSDILVAGTDDILVNLAKCCKPVKGDDIVGFITKGQGVSVHRSDCVNVKERNERIIDVKWNSNNEHTYPTDIFVETITGKNYVVDILTKATMLNIIIDSFKTYENNNTTTYELTIKIKGKEELDKFITSLEMLDFVKRVSKYKF